MTHPAPLRRLARFGAIALALLAPLALPAQTGGTGAAPISESLVTEIVHVSPAGNDSTGNGSASAPYRTIQRGLNRANQFNAVEVGAKVLVAPGTYREGAIGAATAITFPSPATAAPIILEGAGWNPAAPANTGDVIITGSEPWTGWTAVGDGTWTKAWPYDWGLSPDNGAPNVPEVFRRYEMVHVNGATYYQVTGPSDPRRANVRPGDGCFWVDEVNDLITVAPPSGFGDLNSALVEVSVRRRLVHHFRTQSATSPTNIVLRNLVFQHSGSGYNRAAVQLQNVIGAHLEDCVFRDNKNIGLTGGGINSVATFRRLLASGNAEMGFTWRGVDLLAEDIDLLNNSRQADVSQYYGWGYGGMKIGESANMTFRRLRALDNVGLGFWFDTGNVNMLLEDSVSTGNTTTGLFVENNNRNNLPGLGTSTTVLARNCLFVGNVQTSPQNFVTGRGVYITESENVVIEDCVIYDNERQFRIANGPGRGPIANITIKDSFIANRVSGQVLYSADNSTAWNQFWSTLNPATGDNTYFDPSGAVRFANATAGITLDLAGWQALTGADAGSSWTLWPAPAFALEAESGALVAPMIAVTGDPTAFGGSYVTVPNGTGNHSSGMPATGTATYAFEVYRTGEYRIWGRSAAQADTTNVFADDSAWLRVNQGPAANWTLNKNANFSTAWKWGLVNDEITQANPVLVSLRPGFHTLTVAWREDGAKFDRLEITADTAYTPAEPPAPPPPPPPPVPVLVAAHNLGGTPPAGWANDSGLLSSGTGTGSTSNAIVVSGVTDPAPQAVYQNHRHHASAFTVTLSNLAPGVQHSLRLHFCDTWADGPNKRRFHVNINGTRVLTEFDVFQVSGGRYRAHVESFAATSDANGQIVIQLLAGSKNRPMLSGLELWK
jgi:hypothetical protein